MSDSTNEKPRRTPADLVKALVANDGREVTLHFEGKISMPIEGFENRSYSHETLPERTITVTVTAAEIEDGGITLTCFVALDHDEKIRLGLNPDAVGEGNIELEIWSNAVENDGWERPTAYITPQMTSEGAKQHVESEYSSTHSAPRHEVGTLRGIEAPIETEGTTA